MKNDYRRSSNYFKKGITEKMFDNDNVVRIFDWESICAVGNEPTDTGYLWPEGSDEQWFVCPDHLPIVEARFQRIKFKESAAELMEEFRKK